MEEGKTVTVTRQELYEQVWTIPMSRLCRQYGISDVGLAKVCKRHSIPRPPVGYWAKCQHGKAPPRPPLPSCHDPQSETIDFYFWRHSTDPPEYDEEIRELLAKVQSLGAIDIPSSLRSLHPLVHATWDKLEGRVDRQKEAETLDVRVSRQSVRRAVCLMEALVRGIESIGGTVQVMKEPKWDRPTSITVAGETVGQLSLREPSIRHLHVPDKSDPLDGWHSKYDFVPSGRFCLAAGQRYRDGKRSTVEDQLKGILVDLVCKAGAIRITRQRRAKEMREWEEKTRPAREQKAECQRRRKELQEQQRVEQLQLDYLMSEVAAWDKSQKLRAYIRAVEAEALRRCGQIQEGGQVDQWLRWARQHADRIDPITPSPPSVLDERL